MGQRGDERASQEVIAEGTYPLPDYQALPLHCVVFLLLRRELLSDVHYSAVDPQPVKNGFLGMGEVFVRRLQQALYVAIRG